MKKLLIIDFFNLMHRAFHAYPKDFATSKGVPTNAVYGISNLLLTYIKKVEPTHIVVAFEDDEEPTFRSTKYTAYKQNRTWAKDKPEEAELFYKQVPIALEVLDSLNMPYIKCNGYEADDVAGTLAKKAPKDVEVIILSNDQDMLQLTEITNVKVLRPASGPFVKEKIYDIKEVISKFGFEPLKIIDYKALRGDPSDNIPGVKGIGEKTAKDLLAQFNSLEDIYKNIEKIDKERTKKLLAESAEESVLSKELATIDTNIPIQFDLNAYIVHDYDIKKVEEVFAKYEFSSLLKKLKSLKVKEENKKAQEELAGMTSMF